MTKTTKKQNKLYSHHRHTGKILPHHHTSWPLVALILLMLGCLLMVISMQAKAADVTVNATADGPIPTQPATITSPSDGAVFTDIPITVSGTCEEPFLVKLYRNQVFSGSAQCQPGGTFEIVTDLFVGENELEARIFNFAEQEGPTSPAVTVTYDPPGPPTSGGGGSSGGGSSGGGSSSSGVPGPFFITTDKYYKANLDKERIDWTFTIVGGTAPFDIIVEWGDGQKSKLEGLIDNKFSVSHVYHKGSSTRDYYPMKVRVTDKNNRRAMLQVFNILNFSNPTAAGGSLPTGDTGFGDKNSFWEQILYAWPAYAAILLIAASFWLGQRFIIAKYNKRGSGRRPGGTIKPSYTT